MGSNNNNDGGFLNLFKKGPKKIKHLKIGDVGIYHDVLTYYNQNDTGDAVKHNVFTKVRIIAIYQDLVEVEVLDTELSDSVHPCVAELAKTNISKYVSPKNVKWQIN
jgi:hypothetical protein